jgi:hypothetical protein
MKLTGPACIETLSEAEEARRRKRAEGNTGGVRVERRVRRLARNQGIRISVLLFLSQRCHFRGRLIGSID